MGRVIFLGTGASSGIPVMACRCKTCLSKSKFNKRLRPSILIKKNRKNILVDAGPDIRFQALKYNINKLDALIITHAHFDHIAGLDDLRIYYRRQKKKLRCYLLKKTFEEIKVKYAHFFEANYKNHTQSAKFDFHILDEKKDHFKFEDISVYYFSYAQDSKEVLGIRIDDFAYLTDIKRYDPKIFDQLKNLKYLAVGCLRKKLSSVHFNVREAKAFAKKVRAKKTYLTHIAHEIEYMSVSNHLPKNVRLAYDGLILDF